MTVYSKSQGPCKGLHVPPGSAHPPHHWELAFHSDPHQLHSCHIELLTASPTGQVCFISGSLHFLFSLSVMFHPKYPLAHFVTSFGFLSNVILPEKSTMTTLYKIALPYHHHQSLTPYLALFFFGLHLLPSELLITICFVCLPPLYYKLHEKEILFTLYASTWHLGSRQTL